MLAVLLVHELVEAHRDWDVWLCSMLRVTYNITWDGCNSDRLCKIMGKVEMFEHLMSVVSVNIRVMVAGP